MILEVAILTIKSGLSSEFENAFGQASPIIASAPGYLSHELKKCVEVDDQKLVPSCNLYRKYFAQALATP